MNRNPWGAYAAAAATPTAVKLHDVMDEELAAKLQREEEEQWELEMAGRFGDDSKVGWCFVEVPSADCEYGVMSVIQQEISMEERAAAGDDPDYTFALELQAQEAEEYDRLRRQEASSMERIRIIQQEHPKREEIRQTLQRYYSSDGAFGYQENENSDAEDVGRDLSPDELRELPLAQPVLTTTTTTTTSVAAATARLDRLHFRDVDVRRGLSDRSLPKKKYHSLGAALKNADRKQHQRRS